MNQSTTARSPAASSLLDIVGVVTDAQTYKNLLYLLLAFPLGLVYFVFLVVGFSLGLALSVLIVGLGILLGSVLAVRVIASFERRLSNTLLSTEIPAPNDVETSSGGIVDTLKAYLQAASTWKGLGFVFLKFWMGTLSFVLLVSFLGVALELLVLPLFPGGVFNTQVGGFAVGDAFDSSLERALAVPAGAVLTIVALNVLNAFAGVSASIATSLLGPQSSDARNDADSARDGDPDPEQSA